jgi:predicted nucleotidyltransferase
MNLTEIYDMNIRKVLEKAVSVLRESECVDGVFLFGSIPRNQHDSYSDVDLMIMLRQRGCINSIKNIISSVFSNSAEIEKDGKVILFIPGLLKIEFYIFDSSKDKEARKLFVGSNIADIEASILFDRDGRVKQTLREWERTGKNEDRSKAASEADSFLYYYDIFIAQLMRGDSYRTFYYYNLSFFKLATVVALSTGITEYTYAPAWLTNRLGKEKTELLRKISSGLFPAQMLSNKGKMLDLFMQVVGSSSELFPGIYEKAMKISDYINKRYPAFWRLKDVYIPGYIREGVLYRSARLDTQPLEDILKWIKSTGLKTIVDLRNDSEISKHGYSSEVINNVMYVIDPVYPEVKTTDDEGLKAAYSITPKLETFKISVKTAFGLLADPSRVPLLIHCNAGLDRTQMVITTILSSLGLDREIIRHEYEVASRLRKVEYIDCFLKTIDALGGVKTYLNDIGIDDSMLIKIKSNLSGAQDDKGKEQ